MTYTITVPGSMPTLNVWCRQHHYKQASVKKEWQEIILWQFTSHSLPNPLKAPVVVSATEYTKRVRDHDGVVVAIKFGLDALVDGGYLPDDNPKYVSEVRMRWAKATDEEKVVYEITELTPDK